MNSAGSATTKTRTHRGDISYDTVLETVIFMELLSTLWVLIFSAKSQIHPVLTLIGFIVFGGEGK